MTAKIKKIIMDELESIPEAAKKDIQIPKNIQIYEAQGCKKCQNKGYTGRIAIFEILEMTDKLAEIVLMEPSEGSIAKEARRQGMITLRQDGILKVVDGLTSIEEIFRATEESQN